MAAQASRVRVVAGENPVVPDVGVTVKEQVPLRQDLLELFEFGELGKYYTDGELETHPGGSKP